MDDNKFVEATARPRYNEEVPGFGAIPVTSATTLSLPICEALHAYLRSCIAFVRICLLWVLRSAIADYLEASMRTIAKCDGRRICRRLLAITAGSSWPFGPTKVESK